MVNDLVSDPETPGTPEMTTVPRVLVVDDEPEVLDLMVECLSEFGCRVLPASDGHEALRIFHAQRPELVITDLVMPGMNGLELIEAIKAAAPDTEILLITGHSSVASAVQALHQRVFDYLVKPFRLADLRRSVRRALKHRRRVQRRRTRVQALKVQVEVQREELSAGQRRTLGVFNAITDSLVVIDSEFRILEANEGAARLAGRSIGELVGRTCYRELFAKDDVCPGCPAVATFDTHGFARSAAISRDDPSGGQGRREFEVTSYPLVSEAGAVSEVLEHAREVTEQRRAEAERLALRAQIDRDEAMRIVWRLAAGVAHDFNNQLTIMRSYSQFLLEGMPPDDPRRKDVERISATVERGARLVRQLLGFSRSRETEPQSLSLVGLVDDMVPLLRPVLGEGVRLRVLTRPGLWPVRADRAQMEHALMNLVLNARDAIAPQGPGTVGGTVAIEVANVELEDGAAGWLEEVVPAGAYVVVAVRDTGCGMTPEVRRRVFEPFFTTKPPGKGTGLGLATAFWIVKQHRGYITCASEPGRGSTFRIYLPREQERGDAADVEAIAPAEPALPRGAVATVLVAEDDGEVREVARRALENSGHRVLVAGDVEGAVAVASAVGEPIHLLVTDMVMPGGTGPALAERLRGTFPGMKVVFVSGYLDEAPAGPAAPGERFLQKPFSPEALARAASATLEG